MPGNFEIKRMAPEVEPGAPGAYGGPGSIDGKVPGKFWINLRTTDLWRTFSLPTLTYHESLPGHVWQGEYTFKLPLVRSLLAFNAYSEGWALYAEQLADELGVYENDPVGRLGYLQSIAFRACRLVVDTGLHAKRWTREQAIEWFATTNGSGVEEVTSEVERYCAWPGQACGYKVGHSEINRLRAQGAAGARREVRPASVQRRRSSRAAACRWSCSRGRSRLQAAELRLATLRTARSPIDEGEAAAVEWMNAPCSANSVEITNAWDAGTSNRAEDPDVRALDQAEVHHRDRHQRDDARERREDHPDRERQMDADRGGGQRKHPRLRQHAARRDDQELQEAHVCALEDADGIDETGAAPA